MKTILVTGFGPWGDHGRNTSGEAVARLARSGAPPGWRVATAVLDVSWRLAPRMLDVALRRWRPSAVLCVGQAPEHAIRWETVARNRADPTIPDVHGEFAPSPLLDSAGPTTLAGTLPFEALARISAGSDWSVRLSDDAGAYLCNALSYHLLRSWAPARRGAPAGFLHVPAPRKVETPEQVDLLVARVATLLEAAIPVIAAAAPVRTRSGSR